MVALHNKKLTARDIWPDNLWTQEQWNEKLAEFEQQVADEGLVHPESFFEARRRIERWQTEKGGGAMRGQQKVMKQIYPRKKALDSARLTDDDIEYLIMKLGMVNDPFGIELKDKLERML